MSRDESKLLYAESHEWVDLAEEDGKTVGTIGLSGFALEQLTDLGRELTAGEEFGEVESVKAVSPLYSPVSGKVIAVHEDLPESLEKLNDDPYEFGWIVKVEISEANTVDSLLDHAAYQKQCAEAG